jgi:hypothetical protein
LQRANPTLPGPTPQLVRTYLGFALLGLSLGCGDSKPSVPYASDSSSAGASASPPSGASERPDASTAFTPVLGQSVEGDGKALLVGDRRLVAAPGRLFRRWLSVSTADGSSSDVVVWQDSLSGDVGELVVFLAGGGEVQPVRLPAGMELSRCTRELQLIHPAPGLVSVDVRAVCDGRREQWLAVVRLGSGARRDAELRLELSVTDPARFSLRVEDRDGDGRVDLVLGARHTEAVEADPELPLVLLDRPAGYAWDPSEPEASLSRAARSLRSGKDARASLASARRLLSLANALCADFGAATLKTHAGAVRCGEPSVLSEAAAALALGLLAEGDVPRALLVAERLAELDPKSAASASLEKVLAGSVRSIAPSLRTLAAKPTAKLEAYAPLTFDAEGGLLVIEDGRVVRVDLGTLEERSSEALPWPRALAWGASDATLELAGASRRCSPTAIMLETRARGSSRLAPLPSVSGLLVGLRRGEPCTARALRTTGISVVGTHALVGVEAELYELAWGDSGIGVKPSLPPSAGGPPGMPGSGRSADGRVLALALPRSVLVLTPEGATRWTSEVTRGLEACVPRSDAKKVACIDGSRAVVLSVDP